MLIGKTSALTMNIAGVIKDWMLIFFSFYLFHAPVTALNLAGYAFCCSGASPFLTLVPLHCAQAIASLPAKLLKVVRCTPSIEHRPFFASGTRGGYLQLPEAADDQSQGGREQQQGALWWLAYWRSGVEAIRVI